MMQENTNGNDPLADIMATGDEVNEVTGGIKVHLGGREREMRYDFNAIIALEELSGKSLLKGEIPFDFNNMKDLRTLLWASLISDDPTLTIEQAGAMIPAGGLTQLIGNIMTAFRIAFPNAQVENNLNPLPQNRQQRRFQNRNRQAG